MRRFLPSCAVLAASLLLIACAAAAATDRDHVITPADYFTINGVYEIAISPDGGTVAYVEARWQGPDEKRRTDLWVVPAGGGDPVRLSFDRQGCGSLAWGSDGDIYLKASDKRGEETPPHDGSGQIWRVDPNSGDWLALTAVEDGVGMFELSPAADILYYTVDSEQTDEQWADLRKEFDELEYGHGVRDLTEIHALDLKTWRDQTVLEADRVIHEMALSPDGGRLAMIVTDDNELIFKEGWSRVEVLDIESGETDIVTPAGWRDGHPSPFGWLDDLAWSADGSALAFAISYDGYASRIFVAECGADPALAEIARPDPLSYEGGLAWRGGDRTLCYVAADRARQRVMAVEKVRGGSQGATGVLTPGEFVVDSFDFSADGKHLAALLGAVDHTPDIFSFDRKGRATRVTDLNPQTAGWILPDISIVKWPGEGGATVEGVLETPAGWTEADGPLPLVVELHGGPTSHTAYSLRFWIYGRTLLAGNGYALLSPNYRGSTGYGDEFCRQLVGRENDIEVKDILAGVQAMIDRGVADSERIGVMGWSNGGFLTNCVITAAPQMFKAASSGAGVLDQVIQWGTEDTPGHVINYMQGLPWEKPDAYRDGSPIFSLGDVQTPTLIHQGGDDPRVPPAHARGLYRALRHYLDVPCELVIYPGEGHSPTTYDHRLAKMKWDLAWFGKYLPVDEADTAEKTEQ